ncbi:MAG: hypothetical protein WA885_18905 [Phormidesmis sp.]
MDSTLAQNTLRNHLGDFNSIICFRAVVTGIEDALGKRAAMIALVAAGRARGKQLAKELGLSGTPGELNEIAELMNSALGIKGTRLCMIDKIEPAEAGALRVYCRETVCSSGEAPGSERELSYTMGAIQGVLEEVTGKRLRGKQVASVLRGGDHDVIELTPLI